MAWHSRDCCRLGAVLEAVAKAGVGLRWVEWRVAVGRRAGDPGEVRAPRGLRCRAPAVEEEAGPADAGGERRAGREVDGREPEVQRLVAVVARREVDVD